MPFSYLLDAVDSQTGLEHPKIPGRTGIVYPGTCVSALESGDHLVIMWNSSLTIVNLSSFGHYK